MLLILCGPTGVGRSSLIEVGTAAYGWRTVLWVTTRVPRGHDPDRIAVDAAAYERHRADGDFLYDFEFFGHRYAIRRADVEHACRSRTIFATDLLPSCLAPFPVAELPAAGATVVGVVAESEAALVERISLAGRPERAARGVEEQRLLLDPSRAAFAQVDVFVVNRAGGLKVTADRLTRLAAAAPVPRPRPGSAHRS